MGLILDGEPLLLPLEFWALICGILAVLFLLATVVVLQNRSNAHFVVNPRQAIVVAGKETRRWNTIAVWLGFLMRRPGLAGAGLLAQAQEETVIEWRDVYKVQVHRRERVISLSNKWRTVIRLYCPPQIFDEVVAHVRAYAAEGARQRAPKATRAART